MVRRLRTLEVSRRGSNRKRSSTRAELRPSSRDIDVMGTMSGVGSLSQRRRALPDKTVRPLVRALPKQKRGMASRPSGSPRVAGARSFSEFVLATFPSEPCSHKMRGRFTAQANSRPSGFAPCVCSRGAYWGGSSAGRALRSQRRGRGFKSPPLHFKSPEDPPPEEVNTRIVGLSTATAGY